MGLCYTDKLLLGLIVVVRFLRLEFDGAPPEPFIEGELEVVTNRLHWL